MTTLRVGNAGPEVTILQDALRRRGFNPGPSNGSFGQPTEAAVIAFQRSEGLLPDGIVGPRTAAALGLVAQPTIPSVIPGVSVQIVSQMFPGTPARNIERHLPAVLQALVAPELVEKSMVLMSLSTIRAETAGFVPIDEGQSRFNTSPGGHPFDLYDNRRDLGNTGAPDGDRYKGRGFVQLTGRANYAKHGPAIGVPDLITRPELANDPEIAARLLASFIKSKERAIKEALLHDDLKAARRLVNGGSHGLDAFTNAFRAGERLIPEVLEIGV
jgi:peptidoglycan L-alanyl-D-glutamate endopeptidase CwlK